MITLRNNKNVLRCSSKSISYSSKFKIEAVKQHSEGIGSREIFTIAGFDMQMIGNDIPKQCLVRWNRIYRLKGEGSLKTEARGRCGGRFKTKGLSEKDKIERLEAEVAYLKAENDFLAKLRARRAE